MRRAAYPGPASGATKARGFLRGFPSGRKATVAVEFAMLAPALLVLVLGAAAFGIAMDNYVQLTGATSIGARQLAIGRTYSTTPYTDTVNAITGAAPKLTKASITISLLVNGTACASDAAGTTALVAGVPAQVITSYPCNLVVYGTNFAPSGCTLSANTTERVQ
jgi:Flp pilus assembly protein TadG